MFVVKFIIIRNRHSQMNSNTAQDYLHLTSCQYPQERHEVISFLSCIGLIVRQTGIVSLYTVTDLGKGKILIQPRRHCLKIACFSRFSLSRGCIYIYIYIYIYIKSSLSFSLSLYIYITVYILHRKIQKGSFSDAM